MQPFDGFAIAFYSVDYRVASSIGASKFTFSYSLKGLSRCRLLYNFLMAALLMSLAGARLREAGKETLRRLLFPNIPTLTPSGYSSRTAAVNGMPDHESCDMNKMIVAA